MISSNLIFYKQKKLRPTRIRDTKMRKTILLLMAVSLPFFILTSCSKDDDDNGTGKNTHYLKCPDSHHPHAIDLGLPSGTKWACCNVDATTPEGYGGYYAWGETSEKSDYDQWDTYKWYSSDCGITKYCTDPEYGKVDGKTVLDLSDDVARVRMGSPWRMPNKEQMEELIDNCTSTWTQQNGVNGILVTGKNGGQIFLPAAGNRWGDHLNYEGSWGHYWSSSLYPGVDSDVYVLSFNWGGWYGDDPNRAYGQSVRAVCP